MDTKLQVTVGQCSHKGIKSDNEDFYGFSEPEEPQLTHKGIAIAIADGMSSSEAGKTASRACIIGFMSDYYSTPDSWSVKNAVQKILSATNSWLYSNGHSRYQSTKGLVSTLSILILKSNTGHLFHIGDSRIYRLQGDNIEQLTRDHRVWISDDKNYLNRAMGIEPHLEIDYKVFPIQRDDTFLLTTDGVHDFLTDKDLKSLLFEYSEDPQSGAETIVSLATKNKSDDNLTCQILKVVSLPVQHEDELRRKHTNLPFPPLLEPGMILDNYRIENEIHASKRTQIYKAFDTKTQKTVIIKTPSINYEDDPTYIEHFLHEEWAGKRINHQNVLKVLESDRPKQWIYYVTEYVEGITIREWIDKNPLPDVKQIYPIIEQIAKGLRAFHRLEMLHQDLKPENIMITLDDTVKIIDFGSVKIAGISEAVPNPDDEPILGTLNYSAPEYLMGQHGDARSDLFSLAVITYEMLNGTLPFGKDMPEKADRIKMAKLEYVPSIYCNPMVPVWVDGAIKKSVSTHPNLRHNDLFEFLFDLKQPNPLFLKDTAPIPLMQRNPLVFWQSLSAILLLINLILIYFLSIKL